MAGTAEVHLQMNTTRVENTLRVIAKHATACADELALLRLDEEGPK